MQDELLEQLRALHSKVDKIAQEDAARVECDQLRVERSARDVRIAELVAQRDTQQVDTTRALTTTPQLWSIARRERRERARSRRRLLSQKRTRSCSACTKRSRN